jgi:hypothetical protein
MRKILVAVALFACSSLPLMAQDYSKVEIFGGYQYTHVASDLSTDATANGWDGNVTYNINKTVGVEGDFNGAYQTVSGAAAGLSGTFPFHYYTYAGGPVFAFPAGDKLRPFVHVLFGETHFTTSASASGITVSASVNGFTTLVGGGMDLKLSKHVSLRLVQADWALEHYSLMGVSVTSKGTIKIATGVAFCF